MNSHTLLTELEVMKNKSIVETLIRLAYENQTQEFDAEYLNSIHQFVCEFAHEHNITLSNLVKNEDLELAQIILEKIKNNTADKIFKESLLRWKATLYHAVYRQPNVVRTLHASRSTGMAADLLTQGFVPDEKWGTDLDIRHCLGKDLTDPKNIQKPGAYILFPVSLTESPEAFRYIVAEALKAIAKNNITGEVKLQIPVNFGDSHWRLAEVVINNKNITSALLWDSMGGDPKLFKLSLPFANFNSAIQTFAKKKKKINTNVVLADIQHNWFSCMDYVVRKAFINAGIRNEITEAKNDKALRFAIVKQIATNHPNLGEEVVKRLEKRNGGQESKKAPAKQYQDIDVKENPVVQLLDKVSDKNTKEDIKVADKEQQITFDSVFALHLQDLYDQHKNSQNLDERLLVKEARYLTLLEVGFFSEEKHKNTEANTSNQKTKSQKKV